MEAKVPWLGKVGTKIDSLVTYVASNIRRRSSTLNQIRVARTNLTGRVDSGLFVCRETCVGGVIKFPSFFPNLVVDAPRGPSSEMALFPGPKQPGASHYGHRILPATSTHVDHPKNSFVWQKFQLFPSTSVFTLLCFDVNVLKSTKCLSLIFSWHKAYLINILTSFLSLFFSMFTILYCHYILQIPANKYTVKINKW